MYKYMSLYLYFQVRDRKPLYIFIDTLGHMSEFTLELLVADGLWHILSLLSCGHNTSLSVDDKMVLNITKQNMDFRLISLEKIILGAAPNRQTKLKQSGFNGCVEYLNISGYTLPFSGHSLMVEVWPSSTLPQSSCSSPGVCLSSPCSEENTFMRTCLSECQNRVMCRPPAQDRYCICLQNVSDHFCDICISTAHEKCSEMEHKRPLWVIAVVLPLITILVVCMIVLLCRFRQRNSKSKNENVPHKMVQGTENANFCFDDNQVLKATLSTSKEKPHEQMNVFQPNEKFNSDAFLSHAQLMPPSELEYYEIGSICSAFNSDNNSPKLSWHKNLYSTKRLKNDSSQLGDLRMLLGKFKNDFLGKQKCPPNPQNAATIHKQSLYKLDTEQQRQKTPCYTKEFPQQELLEPTQPLSFEEISKLNGPLEPTFSHQAFLKSGPIESIMTTETSSECETDSTFTCSESDYDQFFMITGKKYRHEQPFRSVCNIRQDGALTNKSLFELTSSSTLQQDSSKNDHFAMFKLWEKNVNVPLTFDIYAAVFEDIAGMPMELSHCCDMQSDDEEII
ncbi:protocadherin Fat 4-like [Girardinichthys multiradiatus]|uniref:protocadherin Fat 4-like n=1 Tax=Girardinichthys multiradiatus TaxID=208333 RepID=UPI001FAD6E53|nr:protocadherin Fat 4-like [Girardinichthys multiradiatus]